MSGYDDVKRRSSWRVGPGRFPSWPWRRADARLVRDSCCACDRL